MRRKYRDLHAWQRAIELVKVIYRLTAAFPDSERLGLTAQMRRAAVSVPSNIAEGAARRTTREYLHFPGIARGSLSELDTQLPGPGRTGSAQAVAVLLLLARHTSGLTVPDIAASTNLTREDVAAALYGLRQRHRVRCVWIEQAARWFLIQHTPRSAPAHPSLDG